MSAHPIQHCFVSETAGCKNVRNNSIGHPAGRQLYPVYVRLYFAGIHFPYSPLLLQLSTVPPLTCAKLHSFHKKRTSICQSSSPTDICEQNQDGMSATNPICRNFLFFHSRNVFVPERKSLLLLS